MSERYLPGGGILTELLVTVVLLVVFELDPDSFAFVAFDTELCIGDETVTDEIKFCVIGGGGGGRTDRGEVIGRVVSVN